MKKIYLKLTKDQIERGVVFSSTLSETKTDNVEGLMVQEVFNDIIRAKEICAEMKKPESEWLSYLPMAEELNKEKIARLLDDKFFNGSPWKYNIIRK